MIETKTMDRWRLMAFRAWALIGIALLTVAGLWVLSRISTALTPFIFALVIVFILRRPVAALEARGMSRTTGVALCFLALFLVVCFALIFIVPPLVEQIREFANEFPRYYDSAYNLWLVVEREYATIEFPEWMKDAAMAARDNIASQLTRWTQGVAGAVVQVGGGIVRFLLNVFLSLALAFFVLRDLPTFKSEIVQVAGPRNRESMMAVMSRISAVLEGFFRGQLLIASIVGVATGVSLAVLGVPYAVVIGIIAGVTNLIPYLGPIVGGIIAAISAAFVSFPLVLWTIVVIAIIQQLESTFLQPKIMSDQVNLHPVLVIFSLLVGATVAGLIGMLVAVPIAGTAKALFVYFYEKQTSTQLTSASGALFKRGKCADGDDAAGTTGEDVPCESDSDDVDADAGDDTAEHEEARSDDNDTSEERE